MRVLLEIYADAGLLHGQLRSTQDAEPVAFSGVLDLVAALERLNPEPGPGPAVPAPGVGTEATP